MNYSSIQNSRKSTIQSHKIQRNEVLHHTKPITYNVLVQIWNQNS